MHKCSPEKVDYVRVPDPWVDEVYVFDSDGSAGLLGLALESGRSDDLGAELDFVTVCFCINNDDFVLKMTVLYEQNGDFHNENVFAGLGTLRRSRCPR